MVRSNRGACGGLTGGRKAKRGTHNWHKMANSHKEMLGARKSNKGKHWSKMANSHKEMNGGRRKSNRAGCPGHNGGKSKRAGHQEMKSKRSTPRKCIKKRSWQKPLQKVKGAHKKHYKKVKREHIINIKRNIDIIC